VDWPVRADRDAIDQGVNGVPQKFETGDERDVEGASRKFVTKNAGMIEHNFARPAVDERTRVEIFDATDPQQTRLSHARQA
jgi:hypothetical protein